MEGIFGYRLDEIVQAFVLADGEGEADIHFPAGGNDSVAAEAAVGPSVRRRCRPE